MVEQADPPTTKVWITAYALSKGIIEAEAVVFGESKMCRVGSYSYYHNKDFHLTHAAALERAETMRKVAIDSTKSKLARLLKMNFTA